ncbi:MAG: DUF222 domain-containing protein, partial [Actinomycetota bacterium]|nr:DUF222 domain-containing protein [Actinomycetota bacterium]
ELTQIGSDGGLLAAPVRHTALDVAPAERFDVVVDFAAYPVGSEVTLMNSLGTDAAAHALPRGAPRALEHEDMAMMAAFATTIRATTVGAWPRRTQPRVGDRSHLPAVCAPGRVALTASANEKSCRSATERDRPSQHGDCLSRDVRGRQFVGARLDNEGMNGALIDALAGLSREMDELLPNLRDLVCAELLDAQRGLETLSRKVLAAQVELDAAVEDTRVGGEHGYTSVRSILAEVHRLTPREATAREQRREQLATRRSLTGEVLPPRFPETARALSDGAIGPAHAEVIAAVMKALPERFDPDTCAVVEEQVAGFARVYSPRETGCSQGSWWHGSTPTAPNRPTPTRPLDRPTP